jgi:predicted DCC family thiol-disulfide oxidoreductase YuxK
VPDSPSNVQLQPDSQPDSQPDRTRHTVIYDGNCNLCVNWVRLLKQIDRAAQFCYIPMQHPNLAQWGISEADCQQGMILLSPDRSPGVGSDSQRWQGSDAAEEIARLLPGGALAIAAYRALPGAKGLGDRAYVQIRDNRYSWFGQRPTYWADPRVDPVDPALGECHTDSCRL